MPPRLWIGAGVPFGGVSVREQCLVSHSDRVDTDVEAERLFSALSDGGEVEI
jgi:hypothetical protein